MPANSNHCRSCSDAIAQAIRKEFPND
jgi:hypothetical protein